MKNTCPQSDALTTLKTRLEALDRAGGRRVGAGVRAGSDDVFAPLATGVVHDLYAAAPADAGIAPADAADPATAARIRALRERARALSDQPVGAATPLPDCPPGTADPAAANCKLQP